MVEQNNGSRAHESLLELTDPIILTAVEHLANGSEPPSLKMRESSSVPHGILDGILDPEEVRRLRSAQKFIPALDVSVQLLGAVEACSKTIMLSLPDIDPVSYEAEELPSLFGVFIVENKEEGTSKIGRLITDESELKSMGVDQESIKRYLAAKVEAWLNGSQVESV